MSRTESVSTTFSHFCEKGLVKRQSLLVFLGIPLSGNDEVPTLRESKTILILRHDDAVIRETFNARFNVLDLMDATDRNLESSKREALLNLVFRLYRIGRDRTPPELRRELQSSETEMVLAAIQRLSLMANPTFDELAEYAERRALSDEDLLAHVMDPFQLRYVLSFSHEEVAASVGSAALDTLVKACRRRDPVGIRGWFQAMQRSMTSVPLELPQLLRGVLLELWQTGSGELGVLAQEIAVLDTQLFAELGWETTRAFCAQLRRVTGPGCEALDGYLTDEDIDSALIVSEELKQEELVLHFRKLATSYNTVQHRDTRRTVVARASLSRTDESPYQTTDAPFAVKERKKSFYDSLGLQQVSVG